MKFLVKGLGSGDASQDIVRIHYDNRKDISRHSVIELRGNGQKKNVVVLGHDGKPNEILMDIDLRDHFGVAKDCEYNFEFSPVGFWGTVNYQLNATSPSTFIPARLAVISLGLGALGAILGLVGVVLGVISLCK